MVVDCFEDPFRRVEEVGHLPYSHLEVHLGELEESAIVCLSTSAGWSHSREDLLGVGGVFER